MLAAFFMSWRFEDLLLILNDIFLPFFRFVVSLHFNHAWYIAIETFIQKLFRYKLHNFQANKHNKSQLLSHKSLRPNHYHAKQLCCKHALDFVHTCFCCFYDFSCLFRLSTLNLAFMSFPFRSPQKYKNKLKTKLN
jgi:hypothetical protein